MNSEELKNLIIDYGQVQFIVGTRLNKHDEVFYQRQEEVVKLEAEIFQAIDDNYQERK